MAQVWSCPEGYCLCAINNSPFLWRTQTELFDLPRSSELHWDQQLVIATTICQWLTTVTAGTAQFYMLQSPCQIPKPERSFRHRWRHLSTYCPYFNSALHFRGLLCCIVAASLMKGGCSSSQTLPEQQELFIPLSYTHERKQLKQGRAEESSVFIAPIHLDWPVYQGQEYCTSSVLRRNLYQMFK